MAVTSTPLLPADCPPFSHPLPAIKIFGEIILPLAPTSKSAAIPPDDADEAKSQSDEGLSPRRIDHRSFSGFSDVSDEDSSTLSKAKPHGDAAENRTVRSGSPSACSYASDENLSSLSKGKLKEEGKHSAVRIAFSPSACRYGSDKDLPMHVRRKADNDAPAARYGNIEHICFSSGCSPESHEMKVINDALLCEKVGHNKEKKSTAVGVQEMILRKPDKPVPCPRCESMHTKFCYFNNYNVNQPRHFCRNCQRYWTAGGTLRNVPIGAGRRKNKHSSQHKLRLQEDTIMIRGNDPVCAQPPSAVSQMPAQNSSVLLAPHMEAKVLSTTSPAAHHVRQEGSLQENMVVNLSGYAGLKTQKLGQSEAEARCEGDVMKMSQGTEETTKRKEESGFAVGSCRPEAADMEADSENGNHAMLSMGTATAAFPFIGMPWPYLHMSWTVTGAPTFPTSNTLWPSGTGMPPSFPNAPVWMGSAKEFWPWASLPGAVCSPGWNVPPPGMTCGGASAVTATVQPASPTTAMTTSKPSVVDGLGKRPRPTGQGADEGSLYVPKSLRIHGPEEVAHNSILTSLGVDGKCGSVVPDGIFNAFQPKAEVFQRKSGSKTCEESHNLSQCQD